MCGIWLSGIRRALNHHRYLLRNIRVYAVTSSRLYKHLQSDIPALVLLIATWASSRADVHLLLRPLRSRWGRPYRKCRTSACVRHSATCWSGSGTAGQGQILFLLSIIILTSAFPHPTPRWPRKKTSDLHDLCPICSADYLVRWR